MQSPRNRNADALREQSLKRKQAREDQDRVTRVLSGETPKDEFDELFGDNSEIETSQHEENEMNNDFSKEIDIDELSTNELRAFVSKYSLLPTGEIENATEEELYEVAFNFVTAEDEEEEGDLEEPQSDDEDDSFFDDEDEDEDETEDDYEDDDEDDSLFDSESDEDEGETFHNFGEVQDRSHEEFEYTHESLSANSSYDKLESATSLEGLLQASVDEKFVQTVSVNSELNVILDVSGRETFSEFSRKSLKSVTINEELEDFNIFNPLHRKQNGLALEPLKLISEYLTVLSQDNVTLIGESNAIDTSIDLLAESVNKVVTQHLADSVGLEVDQLDEPLVTIRLDDEISEEEEDFLDEDEIPSVHISVNDIVRTTTMVTRIDSESAYSSASVVTNVVIKIPALVHSSAKPENAAELFSRVWNILPKLLDTGMALRMGVTGSSSFFMQDPIGKLLRDKLSDELNLTGYSLPEIINGESPIQVDSEAQVAQLFTNSSDFLWVESEINTYESEDENEESVEEE